MALEIIRTHDDPKDFTPDELLIIAIASRFNKEVNMICIEKFGSDDPFGTLHSGVSILGEEILNSFATTGEMEKSLAAADQLIVAIDQNQPVNPNVTRTTPTETA